MIASERVSWPSCMRIRFRLIPTISLARPCRQGPSERSGAKHTRTRTQASRMPPTPESALTRKTSTLNRTISTRNRHYLKSMIIIRTRIGTLTRISDAAETRAQRTVGQSALPSSMSAAYSAAVHSAAALQSRRRASGRESSSPAIATHPCTRLRAASKGAQRCPAEETRVRRARMQPWPCVGLAHGAAPRCDT